MKTLPIHLGTSYPVYIGYDLLETSLFREECIKLNKRIVIVTDSHLANTLGTYLQHTMQEQGLPADLLFFPAGEKFKTRETKQRLEDELLEKKYGRDTCLIALGGGVVTDLVGFVGATYCRGLPVIYIPTTLLAMVDASIGGKTGVNTIHGKNLIGTFTQPSAVFADIMTLDTLPENEWRNGVVEMIKHSLIADANLFAILKKNSMKLKNRDPDFLTDMIYASCLIKKNNVEQDEKEQGVRQLLNFGHTIGHAIETIENYRISHGEAVAIGMLVESYLSVQLGLLPEEDLFTLKKTLEEYGLLLQTSAFQNIQIFEKTLMLDKKSVKNNPRFVLLNKLGVPHCHNNAFTREVDLPDLRNALSWADALFSPEKV